MDGNLDGCHHLHTQYFTMEGVHRGWIRNCVKVVEPGGLGNFGPKCGLVQIPSRLSGGQSPQEAEAKCKIKVQFLTFSCANFLIHEYRSRAWTVFLCKHIQSVCHTQLKNSKY